MQEWGKRIDALCSRRCAFALYRLPHGEPRFCMAEDGRTETDGDGFLICTFGGERRIIPAECAEPPETDAFAPTPADTPTAPATARAEYAAQFRRCRQALSAGPLRKVVLARTADVAKPSYFSPYAAFRAAAEQRQDAFTALVHTPAWGTWLICTPELLLQTQGDAGQTMALAGTRPCSPAPWDSKNTQEQALVAEHVRSILARHAATVEETPARSLVYGSIEHLCTTFRFRFTPGALRPILAELPPTPAVSGYPVAEAQRFLKDHPDIDRCLYAGYAGPVGAAAATLFVTLRCMRLYGSVCRLYAGGGIMPDSDEETEWRETESKMSTMRAVLCHDCF